MIRFLFFLVLALIFLSCTAEAVSGKTTSEQATSTEAPVKKLPVGTEYGTFRDLTAKLDSIQTAGPIPGFAVAMADSSGVLYTHGFGYADVAAGTEYTEHTVQHIASVSKILIGIGLLRAQEMGKLDLDDPVGKYLPFVVIHPAFPDREITIRQLATHTSGIQDTEQYMEHAWIILADQDLNGVDTSYPEQRLNPPEKKVTMKAYLREYLTPGGTYFQDDNFSEFGPGKRYNYSNIGATLAALVIEQATGSPYDVFTREHILLPLGMDASGWSMAAVDATKHSRLYRNDNSELPMYTAITYPDGMLISSGSDMAKLLAELIRGWSGKGTLLRPESYNELFREQLEDDQFDEEERNRVKQNPFNGDYNPGLFIGHSFEGYIGHSGGDAGVATWLYFDREKKTGRFIVVNTDFGNDERAREFEYYGIWIAMGNLFGEKGPE